MQCEYRCITDTNLSTQHAHTRVGNTKTCVSRVQNSHCCGLKRVPQVTVITSHHQSPHSHHTVITTVVRAFTISLLLSIPTSSLVKTQGLCWSSIGQHKELTWSCAQGPCTLCARFASRRYVAAARGLCESPECEYGRSLVLSQLRTPSGGTSRTMTLRHATHTQHMHTFESRVGLRAKSAEHV